MSLSWGWVRDCRQQDGLVLPARLGVNHSDGLSGNEILRFCLSLSEDDFVGSLLGCEDRDLAGAGDLQGDGLLELPVRSTRLYRQSVLVRFVHCSGGRQEWRL